MQEIILPVSKVLFDFSKKCYTESGRGLSVIYHESISRLVNSTKIVPTWVNISDIYSDDRTINNLKTYNLFDPRKEIVINIGVGQPDKSILYYSYILNEDMCKSKQINEGSIKKTLPHDNIKESKSGFLTGNILTCEYCKERGIKRTKYYCNSECQNKAWINHKTTCMILSGKLFRCGYCQKTGIHMLRCGGCKIIYYCNSECQSKAWIDHKITCKSISNDK